MFGLFRGGMTELVDDLRGELRNQVEEKDQLRSALSKTVREVDTLAKSKGELDAQIEALKTELKRMSQAYSTLHQEHKVVLLDREGLMKSNHLMRQEIERANRQSEAQQMSVNEKILALNDEIDRMRRANDATFSDYQGLLKSRQADEKDYEENEKKLTEELATALERVMRLEQEEERLKSELKASVSLREMAEGDLAKVQHLIDQRPTIVQTKNVIRYVIGELEASLNDLEGVTA